jgi:hypothetical protein
MDMRFGNWNVRSLYRAGSLMIASKELSKNKFHLLAYMSDETKVTVNQQIYILLWKGE